MRPYSRPESPFWYVEITVDGKPKRIATAVPNSPKLRGKAIEFAAAEERRLNASHGLTLHEAGVKFFEHEVGRLRPSTLRRYQYHLAHIVTTRPTDRPGSFKERALSRG